MSWINGSKKQMGLGKELACFSLLLLMLLHLQITTPCCAANKVSRFKGEAAAAAASTSNSDRSTTSIKPQNGRFKGKELDGDEIFGADKRKVNTGPNPLHNR